MTSRIVLLMGHRKGAIADRISIITFQFQLAKSVHGIRIKCPFSVGISSELILMEIQLEPGKHFANREGK